MTDYIAYIKAYQGSKSTTLNTVPKSKQSTFIHTVSHYLYLVHDHYIERREPVYEQRKCKCKKGTQPNSMHREK